MPPYIAPELKQRVGFWGAPTSTLDWCEENYVTTLLIAEFWNTVSNVWFLILSAVGLWYCIKYNLERRYFLCYLGLMVVGIGSTLFHATLKLYMQLLDELPMLVLSAFVLFSLQATGEARGVLSTRSYITTFFIVAYTTIVSLVYVVVNDPVVHQVAYALMVIAIAFLGFRTLGKYGKWRHLNFALMSLGSYLFAFLLWNIDNHFCPSWRLLRSTHSSTVGLMTQFHASWHFLTATGTYLHLVLSSKLRMEYLGHTCSIKTVTGIPYLEVQQRP